MNLRDELDELAEAICQKVRQGDTGLDQSVDALKVLTAYYAVREKVRLKAGDSDDGVTGNFDTFSGAIHNAAVAASGVSNGTAQPPASRRRNPGTPTT